MNTVTSTHVRRVIAGHFGVKLDRVVDDARLRDLGADWLDRLELLIMIEDQLPDLRISDLVADQSKPSAISCVPWKVRQRVLTPSARRSIFFQVKPAVSSANDCGSGSHYTSWSTRIWRQPRLTAAPTGSHARGIVLGARLSAGPSVRVALAQHSLQRTTFS